MKNHLLLESCLLCVAALLGVASLIPLPAQAAVDMAKLRQAAALPTVALSPSISFNGETGYHSSSDQRDLPAQIAVLQKALNGKDADAERYLQIGKLYEYSNDPAHAKEVFSKSVALYRQQAAERPKDGVVLAGFGTALAADKQMVESETVLRRAVRIAPRQASAWTSLGDFLPNQAVAALLPPSSSERDRVDFVSTLGMAKVGGAEQAAFEAKYGQIKPTAAQIARSLALLDEARACYNQAVTSQPTSATAFLQRSGFRMSTEPMLRAMLTTLQPGETVDVATALSSASVSKARVEAFTISSSSGLSDLTQAARLAPNTFTDVGMSAMYHTMSFILQYSQAHDMTNGLLWDTLTEETRRPLQEAIRPLEQLAESARTNKDTAAEASEAVGVIWLLLGNRKESEPSLRRAIALDPHRTDAWDALTAIMFRDKRYTELTSLLETRVKVSDTARNHLLLAQAADKANQPEKAAAQVQAALKLNPEDLAANMAQAALLLRRSDSPALITEAGTQLVKVGDLYPKAPTPDNWRSYALLLSIYSALTGNELAARQHLSEILTGDKDNEMAKQALAALGPKTVN